MGESFMFLEFKNGWRLAFCNVNTLVDRLNKFILPINEILPFKFRRDEAVCEEDGFLRARFFTQAAENTAQHIDLIGGGVTLLAIEMFFALLSLGCLHGDGFGRAGDCAQATGRAALGAFLVALQNVLAAPYIAELSLGFRISYGSLSLEEVFECNQGTANDSREIYSFRKGHFLLDNNLRSST